MKFFKQNAREKLILILSDQHLGAGDYINNEKNFLEDFHFDRELVDFLHYYSSESYLKATVEIVLNGDFLDFLAVPYIKEFDDEFWSEESSKRKLEMIHQGHSEVFSALNLFLSKKDKSLVYIIGNHDAELILPGVAEQFLSYFSETSRNKIRLDPNLEIYSPVKDICIMHGHQFEPAHGFSVEHNIIESRKNKRYFLPPWGSYYVAQIINKFKQERDHINIVRPIKNFMIYGLIFDTFFTVRFILANLYFLFMAKIVGPFLHLRDWRAVRGGLKKDFQLFPNPDSLISEFFDERPDCRLLCIGHTHAPEQRILVNSGQFINTGTWTKIINLDLGKMNFQTHLTYGHLEILKQDAGTSTHRSWIVELFEWRGRQQLPYQEYL